MVVVKHVQPIIIFRLVEAKKLRLKEKKLRMPSMPHAQIRF